MHAGDKAADYVVPILLYDTVVRTKLLAVIISVSFISFFCQLMLTRSNGLVCGCTGLMLVAINNEL